MVDTQVDRTGGDQYHLVEPMLFRHVPLCFAAAGLLAASGGEADFSASPHVRLGSVGMREARWTAGFWAQRGALARQVMVPGIWKTLQERGNGAWFGNLRIAAGIEQGTFEGRNWSDGDVYKWLEAAALAWSDSPDASLDRLMDEVIAVVAKAQGPDGYISTDIQLTGRQRWSEPRNHEVYNLGHLFTAAAIHWRATGKTNLLAVARRAADYLYGVFRGRPAALAHFSAPSNLMGVVEMYRATRDQRYLELVRILVDMRGTQPGGSDQFQDRVPIRKAQEAVGHAMHATYLYATAADIVAETGEPALMEALERLWRDVTQRKMYVTGAVGPLDPGVSRGRDVVVEAFGKAYELPNREGYNETCANIGNAMWNRRMLALTGEARFADVMELVLYNGVLSGMNVDGQRFFYTNVHRRFGDELPLLRNESSLRWTSTAEPGAAHSYCCPPNLLRTLLKTAQWAYGVSPGAVWVNLFGSSTLETALPSGGRVRLEQTTDYPWSGQIRIEVREAPPAETALRLRIPGWAPDARLRVNGQPVAVAAAPASYAEIRRRWTKGDAIELELPMAPRLIEANPYGEFTRNQVAVARGPLVYCLESADLAPGLRVDEIRLPATAKLAARWEPALLGGITVLEGEAHRRARGDWSGLLYRTLRPAPGQPLMVRLIPYYAWANRGLSHMTVWIPLGD